MKQFTFRLTDQQAERFEHIKKSCYYKSSQAAFDAMVDNYRSYYEDLPIIIAENKDLTEGMLNLAKVHDDQINLLMNIIIKVTKNPINQDELPIEY